PIHVTDRPRRDTYRAVAGYVSIPSAQFANELSTTFTTMELESRASGGARETSVVDRDRVRDSWFRAPRSRRRRVSGFAIRAAAPSRSEPHRAGRAVRAGRERRRRRDLAVRVREPGHAQRPPLHAGPGARPTHLRALRSRAGRDRRRRLHLAAGRRPLRRRA